jgi:hypothetical protein
MTDEYRGFILGQQGAEPELKWLGISGVTYLRSRRTQPERVALVVLRGRRRRIGGSCGKALDPPYQNFQHLRPVVSRIMPCWQDNLQ